jgi:hypothetical protein
MAEVNNDHSDELRHTDIMDASTSDVDMEMTGYDGLPAFFEKYGLVSKKSLKTAVDLCVKNEVEHLRIFKQEGDSLTAKLKTCPMPTPPASTTSRKRSARTRASAEAQRMPGECLTCFSRSDACTAAG